MVELLPFGFERSRSGAGWRQRIGEIDSLADAVFVLGAMVARGTSPLAATPLLRAAAGMKPASAEYHAGLGAALAARGKTVAAADAYRSAAFLDYAGAAHLNTLTWLLDQLDRREEAQAARGALEERALYRAQSKQDIFLDRRVFHGLEGGRFIDIGAHDGKSLSNSWFFEKVRHWSGLCIEPNPTVFASLAVNRACTCLNCGVAAVDGTSSFLQLSGHTEMLSGLVDKYDERHKRRIDEELALHGGNSKLISVATRSFAGIVEEHGFRELDYISIDTEGGEQDILASIDFSRLFVHALSVECNFPYLLAPMTALMHAANFELIAKLESDLIFLNKSSKFHARFHSLR